MENKTPIEQVIKILKENGYQDWASRIENLALDLTKGPDDKKFNAAREIQGLCHVRSLGDLKIDSVSGWEWNTLLEKLNKSSQRKIKQASAR